MMSQTGDQVSQSSLHRGESEEEPQLPRPRKGKKKKKRQVPSE